MSDILKDAYILFNKGKYPDVISLLEPQVFRFREEFSFFYLLGLSCLYQGDYGGSFSYLRRAITIRDNDVNALLGLAAVYLKRGDTGNALRIWLDVLETDPNNVYAQRGLNYLKKYNGPEDLADVSAQDKILKFLPPRKKTKKFPFVLIIIIIAAIILSGLVYKFIILDDFSISVDIPFLNRKSDRDIPAVVIDPRKDFIDIQSNAAIVLSEAEIEDLFVEIQQHLYDYRDNLAMYKINFLLLSNASEYVKERARFLSKYIKAPDLTDFKDNFEYSEVKENPLLYENCYVLWKGKTINISETSDAINFDFLVGYHDEKILEGTVPVNFYFPIRILANQPIELLGKIIIDQQTGELSLEGISTKRL